MNDSVRRARGEAEFVELVGRLGSPVIDMVAMTQLHIRERPRGCFRLRLGDGRVLKYRRMPTAERAEMVERLINLLDSPHLPRVLDRCGKGLLIEFVNARPLRRDDLDSEFLMEAASLHGRIHQMDVSGLLSEAPSLDAERRASQVQSHIGRLVARDALTSREGGDLWGLASSQAPRAIDRGLTHNDFCPHNMLLAPGGRLLVVDNETLGLGAPAFDLARTWYLWPMKPAERAVYWNSYARHRDPSDFASSFLFWVIDAMVRSALFRLAGESPRAVVPLRKLRLILRSSDPGALHPQFI